jgi:hypothetical protein
MADEEMPDSNHYECHCQDPEGAIYGQHGIFNALSTVNCDNFHEGKKTVTLRSVIVDLICVGAFVLLTLATLALIPLIDLVRGDEP